MPQKIIPPATGHSQRTSTEDSRARIADEVEMLSEDSESAGSLTRAAYLRLRQDILSGDLPPGKKLRLGDLQELYGIGISPLREALNHLTTFDLVERIEQRGFRVASVGREEFRDVLEFRCWLEDRMLREAIVRGDASWEEAVLLAGHRLARAPRGNAKDSSVSTRWEALHKAFHLSLVSACGSPLMLRTWHQLYDLNIRYRRLAAPEAYPARDINAEHKSILEAVLSRDADAAVAVLLDHYRTTGKYLSTQLNT